MPTTDLYLAVLPIVHLGDRVGLTEQVLTLFPAKDFATEFFAEDVDGYILLFKNRANKYLSGGHITGYEFFKEDSGENRVVVRVVQNVA